MYKCFKCCNEFNFESELNRHKSRKTDCSKIKLENKCELCNVTFARPAHKIKHDATDKHIKKYNKANNQDKKEEDEDKELENNKKEDANKIKELENKINNLENEIKYLNIENQNLKNNQSLHADYESIYIIHPSQHANNNIYKIGRTYDIGRRHAQYPDGSKLLYSFCCKDSKTVENLILDFLKLDKQTFKLMDFGREYFQCNLKDLRNAVLQFVD